MKNLLIPVFILFTSLAVNAQRNKYPDVKKARIAQNVAPSEMASLQAKKMTLTLDLTDKQEEKIEEVLLAAALRKQEARASRKENKPDNRQERLALAEARMDDMIATKRAIKEILTDDQYQRLQKIKMQRASKVVQNPKRARK